ncbi:MAG: type I glutamate--ammonia ligase [Desulfobacula sp.]|jgi:glutamine synthetase|uniref:type I glutamate--ammonia ligase n=1 Tax=Desulfobacula sp. TaxID=2593537 RepID=UPI001D71092A|nr:type I glutamate--ammonia ligase [Desulfobacula sp.]MBT4024383.1 type I glutamate--ammonia ligase [Desulfobacula sp.]MBT4875587.1 type I glutamate--ammonia ligase [Desulfobacula sp.]MBT5546023.1 type I glutamate--ammonia ligase [Desulfobacula sp.]MBT5972559.1 type I glutamate--ammonia ligase [Desulfobacula sp.]
MEATIKRLIEDEIEFINFQFTTSDGAIRQLINPARDMETLLSQGLGFDGSSCKYVPVNKSDLCLKPDLSTYRVLPWGRPENKTASFICDVFSGDGSTPFEFDPRGMLKRLISEMKDEFGQGWDLMLAPEIEFFLLDKDENGNYIPADKASYFEIPPYDKGCEFRKDISRALDSVGIGTEKNHHEVPPGKHEITFGYGDALSIADQTMVYRQIVKQMAAQQGLIACFMAKPFDWTYGCGMHVHLNLKDSQENVNLFLDESNADYLSNTARYFIAGLLDHAKGLTGITNPSVNSYKRLVPGWEAPVYISWGFGNRSSLLRIPEGNPKAIRVETRNPDSSCNPYLAYAALLVAGLDGVRKKIQPAPHINDNIYAFSPKEKQAHGIENLPGDLKDALNAFEADKVLCNAFGPAFVENFLALKRKDVSEFATTVHPWELEKYVNI